MKTTTLLAAIVLVLSAFITPGTRAKDIVEIRMRGFVYPAPATIPVTIAVEPDAKNRMLVVEADGDSYFRSSAMTLEGADEKRLHLIEFKSVPEGTYVVRARVMSGTAVLGMASEELMVTGAGRER